MEINSSLKCIYGNLDLLRVLADHLLKTKKKYKFKKTGDSRYIYQNWLDKDWFQHEMAYEDFKDLPRRTAVDKVLRDKAFNIAKSPKGDGYQKGLASIVYKLFDKKSSSVNTSGSAVKTEIMLS